MKLRFWFQITVILHPSMSFLEIWIRGGIEMFRTSCKWRHKAIRRLDYPINQFLFGGHETKIKFFFRFFRFFVFFSPYPLLLHNPYIATGKQLPQRKKPVPTTIIVLIYIYLIAWQNLFIIHILYTYLLYTYLSRIPILCYFCNIFLLKKWNSMTYFYLAKYFLYRKE